MDRTVWKMGASLRIAGKQAIPLSGTFLTAANPNKATKMEGNRVLFHLLKDGHKNIVRTMRKSFETIPDEIPINQFSPNEQLAYWLNLHNLVVYEAIADRYPISNLKKFITNLKDEKRLTIEGRKMSLGDIETLVITQWQNPMVIYGFYLGNVGAPDLRNKAYTADNVWAELEANGKNFTAGLRGIQFRKNYVRVSVFYERMKLAFPNFDTNLQAHLADITKGIIRAKIYRLDDFRPEVKDWQIADLYNGRMRTPGSSGSIKTVRLPDGDLNPTEGSSAVMSRYPEHVQEFIRDMAKENVLRAKRRKSNVTIEEVKPKKTKDKDEKKKKN